MRLYETAFLIAPNLPEEEVEALIQEMAEVIKQKKGQMVKEDRWGKRKLAYPIKKFEEAYYVFFLYEGEPDIPAELERLFKQKDAVIRFMTIKQDRRENVRRKKKTAPLPVTPLTEDSEVGEGQSPSSTPNSGESERKEESQ
ncbi:MAG: 30S ribosomal protein S6 [Candidatus Aminicenantes bacterium]|nr:MAG: 30S ribosomal protein S6 [Candidatus Aminicenantes bacterium]RLE05136.1 MAG: 30S ribosomal protein S6 [Candidatus Aminicenantes bacterium]